MKLRAADLRQLEEMGATTHRVNLRAHLPAGPEPRPVIQFPVVGWRKLVAAFVIPERAVPWSVPPEIHRKADRLTEWQATVSAAALEAMGNREPWEGPYEFKALFEIKRFGSMPDAINLAKGAEDALQKWAIGNDEMGRHIDVWYDPDAEVNRASIEVWALEMGTQNMPEEPA